MRAAAAAFLRRAGWGAAEARPLAGDASSRQFWRLAGGPRPAVLMDDPGGASAAFLRAAVLLRSVGLLAPAVYRAEPPHLLVVEDLGDETFAALLDGGAAAGPLLAAGVDVLVALHRRFRAPAGGLPVFDVDRFAAQAGLFVEVCAPAADRAAFDAAWRAALVPALAVPTSLLLRDYFAGNLIRAGTRSRRGDASGAAWAGILDVQDAGLGPVSYDLASLLFDARRDYDPTDVEAGLRRYLDAFPALDEAGFRRSLAILTAQRDMRIAAIFRRLAANGKPGYLPHLPRVAGRLRGVLAAEPALAPVAAWLAQAGDEVL